MAVEIGSVTCCGQPMVQAARVTLLFGLDPLLHCDSCDAVARITRDGDTMLVNWERWDRERRAGAQKGE